MCKVSIIIPVYNTEKFLKKCLDSVLNQTYDDYEVIVVNDCSPDKSQSIIDEYCQSYGTKLKSLINEVNMGQGRSRMNGIKHSSGQWIMFIDSDDYVAPDYVEKYMEGSNDQLDVVVAGYTRDVEGKLSICPAMKGDWCMLLYAITCAKMFRKSFLLEHDINYSDVRYGEDILFNALAYCHGVRYKVLDYYGYYYYQNLASTTQTMNYDRNFELVVAKMFEVLSQRYDLNSLSKERYEKVEYTYLANMVNALVVYGHGGGSKRMKEKLAAFHEDAKKRFPNYRKNALTYLGKKKDIPTKIYWSVWAFCFLERIHLDGLFFALVARI